MPKAYSNEVAHAKSQNRNMCQPCQCVWPKPKSQSRGSSAFVLFWPNAVFRFFLNGGSKLLRMIFAFYLANAGKFAGGNFIIMVKWKCYILWKCIIMSVIKMSLNDTCACPLHSRNHLHGIFWQQQFPPENTNKAPRFLFGFPNIATALC